MEFTYPVMLFGLLTLALPVVIHLFNFRRHKTVYFSNIELLRHIQEQTNKTNNLKHLIVLLLRMLLITCIVFAFAQPFLHTDQKLDLKSEQLVGVYIDNSKSMDIHGSNSSLFEEVRQQSKLLINQSAKESRFLIFENSLQPNNQFTFNQQEAGFKMDEIKSGEPPLEFSQLINYERNLKSSADFKQRSLFYFSDFQKSMFYSTEIEGDTGLNLILVQTKSDRSNNIYIDSCWFATPVVQVGFPIELLVKIHNSGSDDIKSLPVNLTINDIQKFVSTVDIEAGKTIETKMQFMVDKPGNYRGVVSITDFPIVFDDELYFSFSIAKNINVLEIDEADPNKWLKVVFENNQLFHFENRNLRQLDFQAIKDFDLIILNELPAIPEALSQVLLNFIKEGGNMVIMPALNPNSNANNYYKTFGFQFSANMDTVNTRVFKISETHNLFDNVIAKIPENADYPIVKQYYPITFDQDADFNTLMELQNGNPFMLTKQVGAGRLCAFAVPIDEKWSNFNHNNLFVPLFYKMSFTNTNQSGLYKILGTTESYPIKINLSDDQPVKVVSIHRDFEMIPEIKVINGKTDLFFHHSIPSAGFYEIKNSDSLVGLIAFNENRDESELSFYTENELLTMIKPEKFKSVSYITNSQSEVNEIVKKTQTGENLWKYFIILALFFMMLEGLVLRFWK